MLEASALMLSISLASFAVAIGLGVVIWRRGRRYRMAAISNGQMFCRARDVRDDATRIMSAVAPIAGQIFTSGKWQTVVIYERADA